MNRTGDRWWPRRTSNSPEQPETERRDAHTYCCRLPENGQGKKKNCKFCADISVEQKNKFAVSRAADAGQGEGKQAEFSSACPASLPGPAQIPSPHPPGEALTGRVTKIQRALRPSLSTVAREFSLTLLHWNIFKGLSSSLCLCYETWLWDIAQVRNFSNLVILPCPFPQITQHF